MVSRQSRSRSRGKRPHQHVVALARRDRADGEELHRRAGARRARAPARCPGSATVMLVRRHAEIGREQARRAAARDDDALRHGQRRALRTREAASRRSGASPLSKASGWWTSATIAPAERRTRAGRHGAVGEPVDEQHRAAGVARQEPASVSARSSAARMREAARQREMARRSRRSPAAAPEPPVIGVAAGRRVEIAGNREGDLKHRAAPSNQARATWDSCSVTRMRAMPSDPGPSAPARAAWPWRRRCAGTGTRSWCCCPANCGSASRFW